MKVSQITYFIGSIFAGSILASSPLSAQNSGDFLEVKVSLSATNILSSVPAVSVFCTVESSIMPGPDFIGSGQTALYFEGDPDDLTTFDPTQGEFRLTQVIAADRDAIPSEITVKILPTGDIPIDAWTKGLCLFGLFNPNVFASDSFRPNFFWRLRNYEGSGICNDDQQTDLYTCSRPNTSGGGYVEFVRPGFESE